MEAVCKRFDELTGGELYGILKSRAEVFVVEQGIIYQDMDEKDKFSTHLFFKENDRIVSYLRVIDPGVKYPEYSIGRVLTLKKFRGKGLSSALMKSALAFIQERSDISVKMEAQAYLRKFYETLGFRAVSDEFILEGIPHINMIYDGN